MHNVTTILKAIELVGYATPAAKAIYDGFMLILGKADQDTLKAAYADARERSDALHADVQREMGEG